MKKTLLLLCCVMFAGTLTACGDGTVKEKQILEDIKAYEEFAPLNVEVKDWKVVKRQTNLEDKTDLAYCTVQAENEDYSVVRNYMVEYVLYNDGWLLEDIEIYENPDCPDETVPLHGVSHEQVIEDVAGIDFTEYASYKEFVDFSIQQDDLQSGKYLEVDDNGWCTYKTDATYEYPLWIEKAMFPMAYRFTRLEDGSYGWSGQIDFRNSERTVEFSENIVGKWTHSKANLMRSYTGEIEILSYDKNTCSANFYLLERHGEYLLNESKDLVLEYYISDDDYKVYDVTFALKEGKYSGFKAVLYGNSDNGFSVSGQADMGHETWYFERQ